MPKRKTTKVMLPCVIEFQLAKAYLRSSGRPTQDQMMLWERVSGQGREPGLSGNVRPTASPADGVVQLLVLVWDDVLQGALTSASARAVKLAPIMRSWATGLSGSASRTARKTKVEIMPRSR